MNPTSDLQTAEEALANHMKQLAEAVERIPVPERGGLDSIWAPVRDLNEAIEAQGSAQFLRSLVSLAHSIIEIRNKAKTGSPLSQLPVPEYDIWLPFKAASPRRGVEAPPLPFQMPVRNTRIRESASALAALEPNDTPGSR